MKYLIFILTPIFYFSVSWLFPWGDMNISRSISSSYLFDIVFVWSVFWALRFKPNMLIGKISLKFDLIRVGVSLVYGMLCIFIIHYFKLSTPFRFIEHRFVQLLILAPIIEEFVFRGAFFLIGSKAKISKQVNIFLNSFLFAISHLPAIWVIPTEYHYFIMFQVFYTFFLGWMCAKARDRSGGMLIPIIMHFAFNYLFFRYV